VLDLYGRGEPADAVTVSDLRPVTLFKSQDILEYRPVG